MLAEARGKKLDKPSVVPRRGDNPLTVLDVVKVVNYGTYEVHTELVDDSEFGGDGALEMEVAYTVPDGYYIGTPEDAKALAKRGIQPEPISEDSNICSIGFSPQDNKWYGWSHRALYGFGVGDEVDSGDAGSEYFDPIAEGETVILTNLDEAKERAIGFARSVAIKKESSYEPSSTGLSSLQKSFL